MKSAVNITRQLFFIFLIKLNQPLTLKTLTLTVNLFDWNQLKRMLLNIKLYVKLKLYDNQCKGTYIALLLQYLQINYFYFFFSTIF